MNAELDGTRRAAPEAQGRRGGRRLHQRRRRPAGGGDEPLAVREGHRRPPGPLRQHQGPAGSLPHARRPRQASPRQWGQKPAMVTSFADGTKISFEQAIVANATGMTVAKRGMHGYTVEPGTPIMEAAKLWDAGGAPRRAPASSTTWSAPRPGPGVFVLGTIEHPAPAALPQPLQARRGAALLLLHPLPPLPLRGADHHRPRRAHRRRRHRARWARPQVEVVALAKRDLEAGEVIDELGGYTVYGEAEAAADTARGGLLPIGVAVGARLKRDARQGRRPHLRRRGAARGPPRRPAPRRAGGALRPRHRGGVRPPQAGQSSTARPSTRSNSRRFVGDDRRGHGSWRGRRSRSKGPRRCRRSSPARSRP